MKLSYSLLPAFMQYVHDSGCIHNSTLKLDQVEGMLFKPNNLVVEKPYGKDYYVVYFLCDGVKLSPQKVYPHMNFQNWEFKK